MSMCCSQLAMSRQVTDQCICGIKMVLCIYLLDVITTTWLAFTTRRVHFTADLSMQMTDRCMCWVVSK